MNDRSRLWKNGSAVFRQPRRRDRDGAFFVAMSCWSRDFPARSFWKRRSSRRTMIVVAIVGFWLVGISQRGQPRSWRGGNGCPAFDSRIFVRIIGSFALLFLVSVARSFGIDTAIKAHELAGR